MLTCGDSGTIWFTLQSGHKVMLDADLAALYGVETQTLVQAVKRNLDRFPDDFLFQLSRQDLAILRSQSVISSSAHGGRRSAPYAFTEHGALMAATVLNSPRAVEMSLYVVRAFVQLRETLAAHKGLAARIALNCLGSGLSLPRSRYMLLLPRTTSNCSRFIINPP